MVCGDENITMAINATGPLSDLEERAKVARHIFMEIAIPIVCSFGIMGNILNLIVLTREKRHRTLTKMELSAHTGLIALAFSDLVFCLLALLFTVLPLKSRYRPGNLALYYDWLGGGFITIFIVTSTWLIVVMAGERYIAVCHPFRARKLISLCRTRCSITVIFVLCALCTVPIFLERKIVECGSGETYYTITQRWENARDVVAVRRMVWSVLFDFIPCAALIYFNTCLIWKIHSAKKLRRNMAPMQCASSGEHVALRSEVNGFSKSGRREHLERLSERNASRSPQGGGGSSASQTHSHSNPQRQQRTPVLVYKTRGTASGRPQVSVRRKPTDSALNSVTATLVSVVILFLILVSPSELIKFTLYYTSRTPEDEIRLRIFTYVTNFMQALNFSTNFVLYCAINKSFRETLGTLFCWWKARLQRRGSRKKTNF